MKERDIQTPETQKKVAAFKLAGADALVGELVAKLEGFHELAEHDAELFSGPEANDARNRADELADALRIAKDIREIVRGK